MTKEVWDTLDTNDQLECIDKGSTLVRANLEAMPLDWGIVSGGAKGPDTWAEVVADERGMELAIYLPEWKKYGRAAGNKRNTLIAQHADSCLVFWDGESRGTQDFLRKAFRLRRNIWMIGPTGTPWAIWDEDFWEAHPEKDVRMDIPNGK